MPIRCIGMEAGWRMGLNTFQRLGLTNRVVLAGWKKDTEFKYARIEKYLQSGDHVLDVGSGFGLMGRLLQSKGFAATSCDVVDSSASSGQTPDIFDGSRLPYQNSEFSVALLLTVLHHTKQPEQILRETRRVADRVIVIEDVYEGQLQRWLTHRADSLFNLEFDGHPHNNRTHQDWLDTFQNLGFQVYGTRSDRFLGLFRQCTYALRRCD
ncbi:MAG: methyltransferase domain-containing protein [Pseudomonadota bacterium]